jgi:hypothetical protein
LDLRQILIRFAGTDQETARRSILTRTPHEWPAFQISANPLGATLLPDAAGRMRAFVRLALELLGAPPSSAGFSQVEQVSAGGNELLRAALDGTRQFASAVDFVATLAAFAALGGASQPRVSTPTVRPDAGPEDSAVTQRGLPPPPPAAPPLPLPPPPRSQPPYSPPEPVPAPRPITSAKPFLIAAILLMLVGFVVVAGIAVSPWGRSLLAGSQRKSTPLPSTPLPGVNQRDLDDAFREARLAQEAAEKFSEMLSRFEINRQLIQLNQSRRQPDAEALEAYRLAEQTIERQILDSEGALLLHAKQLRTYSPEIQGQAFDRLDAQVSSVGVSWRTRVAELLRRQIPKIRDDALRVDPGFREELKKLQSPP